MFASLNQNLVPRFLIILVVVGSLFGCSGSSEPTYPENATLEEKAQILKEHNIKKLDRNVVSVEENMSGQRLVVKLHRNFGSGNLFTFLSSIKGVLAGLESAVPNNGYKYVQFHIYVPTIDKLGNEGDTSAMLLNYDWQEIKSAKWENLSEFAMADLVSDANLGRFGYEIAEEWCADKDNMKYTPQFCRQYVLRR